jgi:hypothetical protein
MVRALAVVLAIAAAVVGGCGSGNRAKPKEDAGGTGSGSDTAAVPIELPRGPLGADRVDAFAWRSRGGHAAYKEAVVAERTATWPAVVAACARARSADPAHLEAAWLEAAALARQGAFDRVLAPLEVAAAGDWGKWGERSLELALFAPFLATPTGQAWSRAADAYRDEYTAALARALVVGAKGDLVAYDPVAQRWLRITRTYGAVRAAVPLDSARLVAYVAVRKAAGGGKAVTVGVVDLSTGRPSAEVAVSGDKLKLRFRDAKGAPALEVADGKKNAWSRIDWKRGTRAASDAKGALLSPTLVVNGTAVHLARLADKDVTADWDEQGAAGAMRLERSRRTVTAPGTTLFDANTLVWSPDRTRLAVATTPAEPCAAEDREVLVIDVDTGRLRSIDRGPAPAQLAWVAPTSLAVVRAGGAILYGVDGAAQATLAADPPLWRWVHPGVPACPTGGVEPAPEPVADPDPVVEPEPESTSGQVPDAALGKAGSVAPAQPAMRDAGETVLPTPDASR